MNQRQKPGWLFYLAIAGICFGLYALSFGPVWWAVGPVDMGPVDKAVARAYLPVLWLADACGDVGVDLLCSYGSLFRGDGMSPMLIDGQIGYSAVQRPNATF